MMKRNIGDVLARAVKSGLIDSGWLLEITYDLGDIDEICSAFPKGAVFHNDTTYLPDGRSIIFGDFIDVDDENGQRITVAAFLNKRASQTSVAGCFVWWERKRLSHPDGFVFVDDMNRAYRGLPTGVLKPTRAAGDVSKLRASAVTLPPLLNYLHKADYVRLVVEPTERRSPIGRSQKLPSYQVQRRTVKIDWFTYYQSKPSCRENLPPGVSALPLHDVLQHWCERQMSGDSHCPHHWEFADERHKTCSKCGRFAWFRDAFHRGDERNGVIVHDRVTGKRYKVAA